jgi:glycogen debranching enzyme
MLALNRKQGDGAMRMGDGIWCGVVRMSVTGCWLAAAAAGLNGQTFTSIPAFPMTDDGLVIRAHAEPLKPFTVAGERGVVLGQQDGTFEAWVLPVKLLSHMTIEARVDGYSVPINVNQQAAEVEVRPDRTTITYSHIAFTVRQIMFSPNDADAGASADDKTGPMVLFEFDCLHPTDFTLRFTPEMLWMWPERSEGVPSEEWVARKGVPGGYYILHTDYPDLAGAITIPGAEPDILDPYQERPAVYPVGLRLHIDPARDRGRLFPLLMAVGTTPAAAEARELEASLDKLNAGVAASYARHADGYKKLLADSTRIETPDRRLDEAFDWAVVSIEQLKTRAQGTGETALVAGYYSSGDSARPGFGWFFGRDALYTLYAVNGYGDFGLAKNELEFLIHRQRADGKIMHEYSQTAAAIDWQAFPYMYAAADATPLFLLAMEDYVRASGDTAFLTANRDAVEKAWAFETAHAPAPAQGGNGIYENTQGTGWVESWPVHMPHQEVYLALLDQQASAAMTVLEQRLGSGEKAAAARDRAAAVAKTIEEQFYDSGKNCYAFSRNADGTLDKASTVYPALAWWSAKAITGVAEGLAHPDGCLQQFAAHTLDTDWGTRDVSTDEPFYDGMSYHQGSVWPLFTGWAALAEYRAGRPLAGYRLLKQNANLTWAQDLGADTELLSGDFYVPFGRSTSHQLWSSAMVITPALRGLFGITVDAQTKTVTVNPHLPADWEQAEVRRLAVGDEQVDLKFEQKASVLTVSAAPAGKVKLVTTLGAAKTLPGALQIPGHGVEVGAVYEPPIPGARTQQPRVLREEYAERKLTLTVEGMAGSQADMPIYQNDARAKMTVSGAELEPMHGAGPDALVVHFPAGDGWKTATVTVGW